MSRSRPGLRFAPYLLFLLPLTALSHNIELQNEQMKSVQALRLRLTRPSAEPALSELESWIDRTETYLADPAARVGTIYLLAAFWTDPKIQNSEYYGQILPRIKISIEHVLSSVSVVKADPATKRAFEELSAQVQVFGRKGSGS